MAQYIDKAALVAEIEKQRQLIFSKNTGEMKVADVPKPLEQGWLNALFWIKKTINTLEVKEVDLKKELSTYLEVVKATDEDIDFVDFAKHFFELGMQHSKKDNSNEEKVRSN